MSHIVSNVLFWSGTSFLVVHSLSVWAGSIIYKNKPVTVSFRYDDLAASAIFLLAAATARYLGY